MNDMNRQAVDAYLHHLEHVQRRSAQTVRTYTYTLNYWLTSLGDTSIGDVKPNMVEDWARRPRRSVDGEPKTPSAHTMRREIVIVRTFHQWAAERDWGASMIRSAHAPTVKGRTPKPVTDEQWLAIWDNPDLAQSDRVMFGLGYFAGLRRVELVTLRPQDIDVEGGTMRFVRKGGSPEPIEYRAAGMWLNGSDVPTASGFEQWCDLFEETVAARLRLNANFVWWEAIGSASADSERLARRLRAALRAAGLPDTAFTLHQLRHSAATNLLRAGCPPELIRDFMSHSSWDVTSMYAKTSGLMAKAFERTRM